MLKNLMRVLVFAKKAFYGTTLHYLTNIHDWINPQLTLVIVI